MICCLLCVLDHQRWVEERFVASNLCLMTKDGKKYCCQQFVLDCQKWEEVRFVATNGCLLEWALNPEF